MKRVAMVVSTVGYHWEELFRAYFEFQDAGYMIELFTVDGRAARADQMSLTPTGPGALMGLGLPAHIAPATPRGRELITAIEAVRPLAELATDGLDALYLPGGHGCLFDVNRNAALHDVVRKLYVTGCLLSGVCHATSTFAFVEVGGKSIVAGHPMTGFPHPLDRALIAVGLVRDEFLPLPIVNDHELRRAGAKLTAIDVAKALVNPRFMQVSPPFVTGMGPKAAGRVARAVVSRLATRGDRVVATSPGTLRAQGQGS